MTSTTSNFSNSQVALSSSNSTYVLVTAAYNEDANIDKTIQSVVRQSLPPSRWVIVSDGSTDRTDEIIEKHADQYDFIRFYRVTRSPGRSFGSKVRALQAGNKLLEGIPYEFIGNLDADVSVEPSYYENLIALFRARPALGIAGGVILEEKDGKFQNRRTNRSYSVAHAAQVVRRECYHAIGGYAELEYGGEDWHAQTYARMKGWEAETFAQLKVLHYRHTGEGANLLQHRFRQGRMDFSLGSDPLFEILKCLERVPENPRLVGSVVRALGFIWSYIARDARPVSSDFVDFLRKEQRQKIRAVISGSWETGLLREE
jgi:poly-beta-1,6-N-acetyl-D-glucosamine synthase